MNIKLSVIIIISIHLDYENAVLQKRLEELADDEINALMEEIEAETVKEDKK